MKQNNSQYHLNSNLTKYVLYINLFECEAVISVKSGAVKIKENKNLGTAFPHRSLKILRFHSNIFIFILSKTNASIKAKVSLMDN